MNELEQSDLPVQRKIGEALARISVAMRAESWSRFGSHNLNPTQGQILLLLKSRKSPLRLSQVAEELAVSAATVSDSVATLVGKSLVSKKRAADDRRALAIQLSPQGEKLLAELEGIESRVQRAIARLTETDQITLYRSLLSIIRELQESSAISMTRMCVSCRHFRPNVHEDPKRPHHCALNDGPFGDRSLRQNCPQHEPADLHLAHQNWQRFQSG